MSGNLYLDPLNLESEWREHGSPSVILQPYDFAQLAHRQRPCKKGDLAEPDLAATKAATEAKRRQIDDPAANSVVTDGCEACAISVIVTLCSLSPSLMSGEPE